MNEVQELIKLTVVIIGITIAAFGFVSLVMWQNPFRLIPKMFAARVMVALVAYAWVLYFLARAVQ
ncbi:hypothetical protein ACR9GP_25285 [Enterobacter ludwigii]